MSEVLEQLLDEKKVIDAVTTFANAFDAQDWVLLRSSLADLLWTDYLEFRNEPPAWVVADAFVESRRHGLADLKTIHAVSNMQVSIRGDFASCMSAYQIFRVNPGMSTFTNHLFTTGRYEFGLLRFEDRWLINRIKQTVALRTGNLGIHGAFR